MVTATGGTLTISGYPWKSTVTRTSYCGHPGDSGGAVYNRNGALGIEITVDPDHNEPGAPGGCQNSYVPISRALTIFRKRHPSLSI
ncbi:MAG: hypothetical protein ACRDTI_15305 [Mycobacterium sp.]